MFLSIYVKFLNCGIQLNNTGITQSLQHEHNSLCDVQCVTAYAMHLLQHNIVVDHTWVYCNSV